MALDVLEQIESDVSSIEEGSFDSASDSGSMFGTAPVPVVTSEPGEEPAAAESGDGAAAAVPETGESGEAGPMLPSPETVRPEMETVTEDPLSSPAPAPETGGGESTASAPEQTEGEAPAPGVDMAQAHSAVQNAKQAFLNSKRKFGLITRKDDAQTVSLKEAIRDLDALLTADVPAADVDFAFGIESICQAYARLIKSCNDFASHINGMRRPSSTELTRLDLSKQILTQSEKELGGFNLIKGQYIAGTQATGEKWTDVLYNIRAEELNRNEVETKGAGSSTLYIKTNADGSKRYIKAEEKMAISGQYAEFFQQYQQDSDEGNRIVTEAFSLDDAEFRDLIHDFSIISENIDPIGRKLKADQLKAELRDMGRSKWLQSLDDDSLMKFAIYVCKKSTEFVNAQTAGIKGGSTISDRNASSSRVAEALGMGDVVAKSETVLITDQDGRTTRANAMEGAGGEEMGKLGMYAMTHGYSITLTPTAAKQLFELQIFDLITGQVDRHTGNYMAEYSVEVLDEDNPMAPSGGPMEVIAPELAKKKIRYVVNSIKGIDNDLAFGTKDLSGLSGSQNVRFLTVEDKVSIPYLPQDFYDRIMDPNLGNILRFGQLDLRNDEEISAMLNRLEQVRQTLRILVNSGKLQLIADENEWDRILREHIDDFRDGSRYAKSYITASLQ